MCYSSLRPLSESAEQKLGEDQFHNERSILEPPSRWSHSHSPTSSTMDTDELSRDGDDSSQSRQSSDVSEMTTGNTKKSYVDGLEELIKNEILRDAPELADYFYENVKNDLVCATESDLTHIDQSQGVSLLQLTNLEAFGLSGLNEASPSISVAGSSTFGSVSSSYFKDASAGGASGTGDSSTGECSALEMVQVLHSSSEAFISGRFIPFLDRLSYF